MIIAGDFISISLWQICGVAVLMSIPAQIVAVPILLQTFQHQKVWLWSTILIWTLILPVLLIFLTEWLAPGIHSAAYRYSVYEQIFKLYLPFYGIPPFLAGIIWFIKKKRAFEPGL